MADYALNRNIANLTSSKQDRSYRRGDRSYGKVVAKYNTKLNCIHTKAGADRQKDRSEDQDCRGRVHESSYEQQNDVDQQEDQELVACHTKDCLSYHIRNSGKCHCPGHDGGKSDHESDGSGDLCRIQNDAGNIFQLDRTVDQGQNGCIDNCNC